MQKTLEKPIANEPVTNFARVARHETFMILPDLNMVQSIRVVTVDGAGKPITELISEDPDLSPIQRQKALIRYEDQLVTRQTQGAFIDPKTGKLTEPEAAGAITQLEHFQAITLGDLKKMGLRIADDTPFSSLLYALMGNEITNIDKRGDL